MNLINKYPIIIAEVGVNFNGSLKTLKNMINKISTTGVDFVKFQLFNTDEMCIKNAPKAFYQKKIKASQYSMLKKYELSEHLIIKIINQCKKKKINPLFSVFDIKSLKILLKYKPNFLKIPSGEINNIPLLKQISKSNLNIFLSTGMASEYEIKFALNVLTKNSISKKNIFILHCHSDYPSKLEDLNLIKIDEFSRKFKVKVGFSDHSIGHLASIASVVMGAKVVEKHVTLDRKSLGPDHSSSLEIKDLNDFVENLKNIKLVIGKNNAKRSSSEIKNKKIVRKSIVALCEIKKGETFTEKNLGCKRPAYGLSPMQYEKILGKKAKVNFKKNSFIKL